MNLKETVKRRNEMRSDYGLYVVAVICFIIAGIFLTDVMGLELTMTQSGAAIFGILGILFAAGGYALRPKVAVPTPRAPPPLPAEPSPTPSAPPVEEKVEEAPPAPPPPTEEEVPSIPPTPPPAEIPIPPTPAPALEEPAKVEEEKPAEKPVRRRRRKKTA